MNSKQQLFWREKRISGVVQPAASLDEYKDKQGRKGSLLGIGVLDLVDKRSIGLLRLARFPQRTLTILRELDRSCYMHLFFSG